MIYIIMGVSGCGKSTLGAFLSEKLGWALYEGDDFHPKENIEKMADGKPLTDQDRLPWLLKLHDVISKERCSSCDAIVVCSALRRLYRQILLHGHQAVTSSTCPDQEIPLPIIPDVHFIFLYGTYELIHRRMAARRGHFMNVDMLRSQFSVLEPPLEEKNVLPLDIKMSVPDIAMEIEKHLLSLKSPLVL
ncbi:probable gluconokinase isoform X2 [Lampris incognitus]|uniref:probable gluconokinase isoform X2 n=1 Tax=Lampris incognitus TaxID=2546036 RepID=UPI0024B54CC9|nr:probable gluconokinase isoform X2 [Lampris incognitus]